MIATITAAEARKHLDYNPETGVFQWKLPGPGRKAQPGSATGNGYHAIYINGRRYKSHRLAWLMVHGEMPERFCIDHINGNPSDNRVKNLRLCTNVENSMNSKLCRRNTSGVKGVSRDGVNRSGARYRAAVSINGARIRGVFDNAQDAENVMKIIREALHGKFARHA